MLKPSTRAFIREAKKTKNYNLFDLFHGYIYTRWPYLYIGVATGEHPLTRIFKPLWESLSKLLRSKNGNSKLTAFADTYHGKVVSPAQAGQLVTIDEEIDLGDLEHIIPYTRARDIVMLHPDHIVALECPCRASRPNPCEPLDVCLIIGEPFVGFVLEHHPRRSRRITQKEALQILNEEHARGHVHHAFFKDAMLGRFYAICNCCACCCGAMQAWRNGIPMLASSGYISKADQELCQGCGTCVEYCQFGALELKENCIHTDEECCMGCGVCVSKCPHDALVMARAPQRGEPLEIQRLITEKKKVEKAL